MHQSAALSHWRSASERANLQIDEFVMPDSRWIERDGVRLHYLDWDGGAGPTVIFLHGGGLTAHTWDLICLALRDEYRCVALDQRGHGDSDWSSAMKYGFEDFSDDIDALVDALGLDEAILVGMSLGGLNAIEYARRRPDRLAGLVLIDVGPELRTGGTDRIKSFMAEDAVLDSIESFVARAMSFNTRRSPEALRFTLQTNLRQLPDGRWTWKYDRDALLSRGSDAAVAETRRLAGHLASIACPVLVVRGAESDVFFGEDAERLAARVPDGRWVEVAAAGHHVQGDNPQGLVDVLRAFLGELGR